MTTIMATTMGARQRSRTWPTHVATIMTAMTIMIAMPPADGTARTTRICRPALAKRDRLPPGLERQLVVRGTLPPGLRVQMQPCPHELEAMFPPPPPNYAHVVIGGNLVLVNRANFQIADVFHLADPLDLSATFPPGGRILPGLSFPQVSPTIPASCGTLPTMSSLADQMGFNFRPPERRVWKVRDLVASVRSHIEREYSDAWVEGEISNFRAPDSGHLYFTLKDGNCANSRGDVPFIGATAALPSSGRPAGGCARARHRLRRPRRTADFSGISSSPRAPVRCNWPSSN